MVSGVPFTFSPAIPFPGPSDGPGLFWRIHAVTSTPPPLPASFSRSTPWLETPPGSIGEPSRMNWSAILASASAALALVFSVLAWIVTHPHKAAPPLPSASTAAVETPTEPAPPPPQTVAFSATPAFHRSHPQEMIAKNIPLLEEDPPPLPPPSSRQPPQLRDNDMMRSPWQIPPDAFVKAPKQSAGETYGTKVLFLNNQTEAADLARQQHKLLFVMHISGNFEDSCFT